MDENKKKDLINGDNDSGNDKIGRQVEIGDDKNGIAENDVTENGSADKNSTADRQVNVNEQNSKADRQVDSDERVNADKSRSDESDSTADKVSYGAAVRTDERPINAIEPKSDADRQVNVNEQNSKADERVNLDAPKKKNKSLLASIIVYCAVIPAVIALGIVLFKDRKYNIISIAIAFLTCVPFFFRFEKQKTGVREMVVIAVMTAISVVGRMVFAPIPFFKPVTAIVIITAIAFGGQAGFIVGSFTAIVSNIYFGQGPWTPFQMLSWGLIGLVVGLVTTRKKKVGFIFLALAGIIGGAAFSLLMDVWTTVSAGGTFTFDRYLMYVVSALPVTITYMYSNVIFLLVLTQPILNKLNRVKTKYGLFAERNQVVCTLSDSLKRFISLFKKKRDK